MLTLLWQAFHGHWSLRPGGALLLLLIFGSYLYGWLRMRRAFPHLAGVGRLLAFGLGLGLVAAAFLSPLNALYGQFQIARTLQQLLLGLFAPPLIWLGCPIQLWRWSLPLSRRRWVKAHVRRRPALARWARRMVHPVTACFLLVAVFVVWHDPMVVDVALGKAWLYQGLLGILLGSYLLFWWHVLDTGSRIGRALPVWMTFAILLICGEFPNMVAGMGLAFRPALAYSHYAVTSPLPAHLLPLDQVVSGGLIWVSGSLVYFGFAIAVLGRLFRHGDAPPVMPLDWTRATERTIAPGLEHRITPGSGPD